MNKYRIDREGRLFRFMDNVGPFKYWHLLEQQNIRLEEDYYFEANDNNDARLLLEVGGYNWVNLILEIMKRN